MSVLEAVGLATVSGDLESTPYEDDLLRVGALGMAGIKSRLGVEMVRAYTANDRAAVRRAVQLLSKQIIGKRIGRNMAEKIAAQVIREYVFDKCHVCGGTGTRMVGDLKVVCYACSGVSVARYSDASRARALGLSVEAYRRGWNKRLEDARYLLTFSMATAIAIAHAQLGRD